MNKSIFDVLGESEMGYDRYIEVVLYDEEFGYYAGEGKRIGREEGTDFYTAECLGGVFRRMVMEFAREVLGEEMGEYTFVEMGVDSVGMLESVKHGFKECKMVGYRDKVKLERKSFVFGNEVFDALPFRRFIFRKGKWREMGVRLKERRLEEVELGVADIVGILPEDGVEGYVVDFPMRSVEMLGELVRGVEDVYVLFFDYGYTFDYMMNYCPQGTARGYYKHNIINNILEHPGKMDITCHVIWDSLEDSLKAEGFNDVSMESQESFFVKRCEGEFRRIVENGTFEEKRTLMELVHPGHMGRKFQVLSGKKC